jgi:ATP-dependent exoDNAse (exonuclease V) alpha subunit
MVADWVYHDNPGNPHIHLMTTLRPLTEEGFGSKKVAVTAKDGQPVRTKSGKILYELWAGSTDDFNSLRDGWFERLNHHLALGGIDLRIDGRSYEKQGIDLERRVDLHRQTQGADRTRCPHHCSRICCSDGRIPPFGVLQPDRCARRQCRR